MAKKSQQQKKHKELKKRKQKQAAEVKRQKQIASRAKAVQLKQQAEVAWGQSRFDDAIGLFEQAVELTPNAPSLLVDLARSYGIRFFRSESKQITDRILERFADNGHVRYMLGESEVKYKNFVSAEAHYRAALGLELTKQIRVRTLVALARILERLHRLDEARETAGKALAEWPQHPKANLILAKVCARQDETDRAAKLYENLASRTDVSPDVKADSWFAIAKKHEAEQEYSLAYEAFCKAKTAYHGFDKQSLRDALLIRERHEAMLEDLSAQHTDRWAEQSAGIDALSVDGVAWLVGHPRSGTTLIEQVLDSHQRLTSADELVVFASSIYPQLAKATGAPQGDSITQMLDIAAVNDLNEARKNYIEQIEVAMFEPVGKRILLDKNPEMTLLLPVICRVFPEGKILFALRDPRDVVISCFTQALPLNSITVDYRSLETTAKKYALVMNGWLKIRGLIKNNWLEVRYEETVADLEGQAKRTLDFLGLEWDAAVMDFHKRAQSKHVHSPTYEAVTKPVYSSSVGRWKNYQKQMEPILDILDPFVKEFGYD